MSKKGTVSKIHFFYPYGNFFLPDRSRLKNEIQSLFSREKITLEQLDYIFCSDAYLFEINRDFLAHQNFTDIITFSYSPGSEPVIGEIYISIDRIKENAKIYEVPFHTELYRVVFHGALHLCGYKDKKPAEIKEMRQKEDDCLRKYIRK